MLLRSRFDLELSSTQPKIKPLLRRPVHQRSNGALKGFFRQGVQQLRSEHCSSLLAGGSEDNLPSLSNRQTAMPLGKRSTKERHLGSDSADTDEDEEVVPVRPATGAQAPDPVLCRSCKAPIVKRADNLCLYHQGNNIHLTARFEAPASAFLVKKVCMDACSMQHAMSALHVQARSNRLCCKDEEVWALFHKVMPPAAQPQDKGMLPAQSCMHRIAF